MSNVKAVLGQSTNIDAAPVYSDDVFSTHIYRGQNLPHKIENGIDLANHGGLVWFKKRTIADDHYLFDTERGSDVVLKLNDNTSGNIVVGDSGINSFDTDGFTFGSTNYGNTVAHDYVAWTFRKQKNFFDIVTWTGDGSTDSSGSRLIEHNLGSKPGFIIVTTTSRGFGTYTYHRSLGATYATRMDTSIGGGAVPSQSANWWYNVEPTSTHFSVNFNFNDDGVEYIAYVFGHNDDLDPRTFDFGENFDEQIIYCGEFTGVNNEFNVNLGSSSIEGFEPQWVMMKRIDSTGPWEIFDTVRGSTTRSGSTSSIGKRLEANVPDVEGTTSNNPAAPRSNGFMVEDSFHYGAGKQYIYVAIGKAGMKRPNSGTDVFHISRGASPYQPGWPVDWAWARNIASTGGWYTMPRMTGATQRLLDQGGGSNVIADQGFDSMTEWGGSSWSTPCQGFSFRRARGFYDMFRYFGTGTKTEHKHNLGVEPEMIWSQCDNRNMDVVCYYKQDDYPDTPWRRILVNEPDAGGTMRSGQELDLTQLPNKDYITWLGGTSSPDPNISGDIYLTHLFASLPGISKVGTYTGNSGSQTIDCGFTTGARFVIIKNTNDSSTSWIQVDVARGINSGNDSTVFLNSDQAEVTTNNYVDPDPSGFSLNTNNALVNLSGKIYLFYAIA